MTAHSVECVVLRMYYKRLTGGARSAKTRRLAEVIFSAVSAVISDLNPSYLQSEIATGATNARKIARWEIVCTCEDEWV